MPTPPDSQDPIEPRFADRPTIPLDIPCDLIRPNPFQAREHFDPEALEDLANTIRTLGLFDRLRVRENPAEPGVYQLVFGERRLRAAKLAGFTVIPVSVGVYTDEEMAQVGLVENVQRENLSALEEGKLFRRLLDQEAYSSIPKLAKKIGKHKNYVEERLALLRLPDDVREIMETHPKVSLRALIELAKLPTKEARTPVIAQLEAGELSTEEVRTLVREVLARLHPKDKADVSLENATDALIFQRGFHRTQRRVLSAMNHLEVLVQMYENAPTQDKKAKLLAYLYEITEQLQHVRRQIQ